MRLVDLIGVMREPEAMRHAQLTLTGLAIVCTVSGLSIGRSLEGKRPVGSSAPEAELHVRWTAPDGALEEPRHLPDVAASPLGIPVEIPADGTYLHAGENPLRRRAEGPSNAGAPRTVSRLPRTLGPGAIYFEPIGADTSRYAGRRAFEGAMAPVAQDVKPPARPVGGSIRIPRISSRAQGWATW